MKSITFLAAVLFATVNALEKRASTSVSSAKEATPTAIGVQEPSAQPTLNVITVQGCFSSPGDLVFNSTLQFNTKGSCAQDICFALGYPVSATSGGNQCYCGKKYPPKDKIANDSKCNIGCTGYNLQACGGVKFWTVYNTGLSLSVDTSGEPEQDHPENGETASTTKAPTAVVTLTGSTAVITQTIAPSDEPKPSTTNVGAIAAGVVVSVVVVAAAIAGMFFFLRRKRNKEIEEEHRRNAAVNSFSGKPPSSSGGMSILDARLDPVMAQRRMSDGSIADNQDYSRKILRVGDSLHAPTDTCAN
ncbi:wsc domain protein [Lasiosphaeris hirsuta]|uniref:Wsc domain protein n=1 Tax=Lasiosphaeris hirsuta TaxID=260670 RepID=A0AA40B893_9PEZI|nr:wsc domain protein [Lasiosphaeris hirsuta]